MNNERLIPEILFHPSDIGIDQAGIAEAIVQSVNETCSDLHELFYGNIILMGGSTLFPGFKERLYVGYLFISSFFLFNQSLDIKNVVDYSPTLLFIISSLFPI
jgi:hypothetical protein